MWTFICLKCLKILLFTTFINASLSGSNDLSNQDLRRDINALEKDENGRDFNDLEMAKFKIWSRGVIPYYIDTVSYDADFRKKLEQFLESFSQNTGVQFAKISGPPKDDTVRWVFFVNRRETPVVSHSYTAKDFTNQGVQKVVLSFDSPYNGELYEVILAILGIPPQHNAPNRDEFITVNFDNIIPDHKHLFEKLKDDEWLFQDVGYDVYSAGHYGLHKYSANGKATIEPKFHFEDGIGDGNGLSYTDVRKIRIMYNRISKSHTKAIKLSSCQKMFKRGSKFNSDQPDRRSESYKKKSKDDYDDLPRLRAVKSRPIKRSKTKSKKTKDLMYKRDIFS